VETGPVVAFATSDAAQPGLEIRINFGMLAGREATAAEIDELASALLPLVGGDVSIVSEERHEVGETVEAVLHQVRVEVAADRLPPEEDLDALGARLVEEAVRWTDACVADRHVTMDLEG